MLDDRENDIIVDVRWMVTHFEAHFVGWDGRCDTVEGPFTQVLKLPTASASAGERITGARITGALVRHCITAMHSITAITV